jgi:hypothetical protein
MQPAAEKRPAEKQAAEKRPAEKQAAEMRPAEKQAAEMRPAEKQAAEMQAAEMRPAEEQPAARRPYANTDAVEHWTKTRNRSANLQAAARFRGLDRDEVDVPSDDDSGDECLCDTGDDEDPDFIHWRRAERCTRSRYGRRVHCGTVRHGVVGCRHDLPLSHYALDQGRENFLFMMLGCRPFTQSGLAPLLGQGLLDPCGLGLLWRKLLEVVLLPHKTAGLVSTGSAQELFGFCRLFERMAEALSGHAPQQFISLGEFSRRELACLECNTGTGWLSNPRCGCTGDPFAGISQLTALIHPHRVPDVVAGIAAGPVKAIEGIVQRGGAEMLDALEGVVLGIVAQHQGQVGARLHLAILASLLSGSYQPPPGSAAWRPYSQFIQWLIHLATALGNHYPQILCSLDHYGAPSAMLQQEMLKHGHKFVEDLLENPDPGAFEVGLDFLFRALGGGECLSPPALNVVGRLLDKMPQLPHERAFAVLRGLPYKDVSGCLTRVFKAWRPKACVLQRFVKTYCSPAGAIVLFLMHPASSQGHCAGLWKAMVGGAGGDWAPAVASLCAKGLVWLAQGPEAVAWKVQLMMRKAQPRHRTQLGLALLSVAFASHEYSHPPASRAGALATFQMFQKFLATLGGWGIDTLHHVYATTAAWLSPWVDGQPPAYADIWGVLSYLQRRYPTAGKKAASAEADEYENFAVLRRESLMAGNEGASAYEADANLSGGWDDADAAADAADEAYADEAYEEDAAADVADKAYEGGEAYEADEAYEVIGGVDFATLALTHGLEGLIAMRRLVVGVMSPGQAGHCSSYLLLNLGRAIHAIGVLDRFKVRCKGRPAGAGLAPGATAVELTDDRRAQELAQELDEKFRSSGVRGCCGVFARPGPGGEPYLTDGLFAMALRKSALPLGHKVLMCVFRTPSVGFAAVVAGVFAGRAGEVGDLRRLAVSSCGHFMQLSDSRDFAWFVGCLRRAEALKQFWADGGDAGRQALPQLAAGLMAATIVTVWYLARFEWLRHDGRQPLRHGHTLLEFAGAAKRVVNLLRPPAGAPALDYDQMLAEACSVLHSYVCWGRGGGAKALALMVDCDYEDYPAAIDYSFKDYAAIYGLPGLLMIFRVADHKAAELFQGLGPQLRAYVRLRFLVLRMLARAVRRRKAAALAQLAMMPPGGPFPGGEGYRASEASYRASAASYRASAACNADELTSSR